MNTSRLRKLVFLYPLLMILCGIGYAKYDTYQLDGDAVAFMDISDAINAHNWSLAANGYWNPAYAAALAIGHDIAHPSRWGELQTFFWVNFFIFVGCIGATIFCVTSLLRVRQKFVSQSDNLPAFSDPALLLTALALLFIAFVREISLGTVRADALLLFFFLIAAGILLRLQETGRFYLYPLLGIALGLSYLTKSFAFLPSGILLFALLVYGITRPKPRRGRIVAGVLVAGILFAAICAPYIAAISKQRGRLTTGESARLNYCFFVDETPRWHEWHLGDLGHATADFKHHEQLLSDGPPVYSYAQHPLGTYPLWFDPSYWTDTLKPKIYLKGHIKRLARTTVLAIRYVTGHLEPFVVFLVLILAGCFLDRRRALWLPLAAVPLWGLLMLGIYFPIDLQDRYLVAPFLFLVVPILAALRRPKEGYQGHVATTAAVLLALLVFAGAVSDLGERSRHDSVDAVPGGAYDRQIYPAAHGIAAMGIAPGSLIACIGDKACYVDHYWARLAQTPIRAEVEVKGNGDPGAFWTTIADKQKIVDELRQQHIQAIVGIFAPSTHIPDGWQQLGTSNFYAYRL